MREHQDADVRKAAADLPSGDEPLVDGAEVLNDVVLNQVLLRFDADDERTSRVIEELQRGGEVRVLAIGAGVPVRGSETNSNMHIFFDTKPAVTAARSSTTAIAFTAGKVVVNNKMLTAAAATLTSGSTSIPVRTAAAASESTIAA